MGRGTLGPLITSDFIMKADNYNLELWNAEFREKQPEAIIAHALKIADNPVLTTNFRPYEVALIKAVSQLQVNIPVIWCDTGYNTRYTYQHAESLIATMQLQVHRYVPRRTAAHRDAIMGIPGLDDPRHAQFTEEVKLEPFRRAMKEHRPDCWFTNLRKGQTAHRDSLDIFNLTQEGVLKVSPFYHWSDKALDAWLEAHDLPNEHRYYDPTKVLSDRECGLHR